MKYRIREVVAQDKIKTLYAIDYFGHTDWFCIGTESSLAKAEESVFKAQAVDGKSGKVIKEYIS